MVGTTCFIQGMDQNANSFQIIQPSPPIASGTAANSTFWSYFNNIPPLSLTQQFIASGGNQFYNNYRALMSALVPTRSVNVEANIGSANFRAWQTYILGLLYFPNHEPDAYLFRNWAMIFAPSVANIGSSDYASILLESYCYRSK